MNMEEKEFLRNESVYVRRSAAGTRIHPVPCWPNWQRIQITT